MPLEKSRKKAVIIGAGPAGLTAAYELLSRTDIQPIVLEADPTYVGGLSRTVSYKGNRIDIGGHRFFSKSDRIMDWWLSFLPAQTTEPEETITYHGASRNFSPSNRASEEEDQLFLVRNRKSRIYYKKNFFNYPITLSWDTLRKLGLVKLSKIGITYTYRRLLPRNPEVSLEDFFINRFGDELYNTFFKSYTEKVWGIECSQMSREWGSQRIKGLSVSAVLMNALMKPFRTASMTQKKIETSLIERFLYPKYGPGHLWETVASEILEKGGELYKGEWVTEVQMDNGRAIAVITTNSQGEKKKYDADFVFSTMPVRDLCQALDAPENIREISDALQYREFMTAGLLLNRENSPMNLLTDNWLYVHEPGVDVGRIQLFNNWSPYMVGTSDAHVWVGLEYFCNEGDRLWSMSDEEFLNKASQELRELGLSNEEHLDGTVIRQKKAYTAYAGSYARFGEVRDYLDSIPNLFPIGRNGMHRYNNQDHSMLVAMTAVDNIVSGREDKSNLWEVNADEAYHEEK